MVTLVYFLLEWEFVLLEFHFSQIFLIYILMSVATGVQCRDSVIAGINCSNYSLLCLFIF